MTNRTGAARPLDKEVYRIPFDGPASPIPTKDMVGSKAHNLMRLARRAMTPPAAFV
jgi:hypothetical protein